MTQKKTRVMVLNDGSHYENWGIKACIDGLTKTLRETVQDAVITGLPHEFMHRRYDWDPKFAGRQVFNENSRVARRLLKPYHVLPRIADEFECVAELWASGQGGTGAAEFIRQASCNDLIVFNGEGSTYRDNIGAVKGLFMLWYAKTKLNKRCYFMNGSVTLTLVDATLPAMIKKVFGTINGVAVREPYSLKNVQSWYPALSVKMIPDSVFGLELANYVPERNMNLSFLSEPFFCFSLSMLPMDFRQTKDKSAIVALIKQLQSIVPNAVLLAKDIEDQVLQEVARLTGAYFVGPTFSYSDISYILSKAAFLFSGRYHHLIFATKVGCPVIPMASSSHKIHGLAALFDGLACAPIDPTDLWSEQCKVLSAARDIVMDDSLRGRYLARTEALMADVKNGVYELLSVDI